MESNEFYSTLASLPSTYRFDVEGKAIKGRLTRGAARGATLNPVTAVAYRTTGQVYGTNKRETLKAGTAVGPMSKFRMAINDRRNDKTLFINVLCFGKMAENLNPRLVRGRPVSIQGKLNIDDYEDENQNKRSSICIMADEISLGKDPNGTPSETMEELEEAV